MLLRQSSMDSPGLNDNFNRLRIYCAHLTCTETSQRFSNPLKFHITQRHTSHLIGQYCVFILYILCLYPNCRDSDDLRLHELCLLFFPPYWTAGRLSFTAAFCVFCCISRQLLLIDLPMINTAGLEIHFSTISLHSGCWSNHSLNFDVHAWAKLLSGFGDSSPPSFFKITIEFSD